MEDSHGWCVWVSTHARLCQSVQAVGVLRRSGGDGKEVLISGCMTEARCSVGEATGQYWEGARAGPGPGPAKFDL